MRRSVVVASIAAALAMAPAAHAGGFFEPLPLKLSERALFDLGAVDYDADGDLDLFSVNHSSRGSLLLNDGNAAFSDAYVPAGMSHTRAFPSWELLRKAAPDFSQPGIYVYQPRSHRIAIRFQDARGGASVRLRLLGIAKARVVAGSPNVSVHRQGPGRGTTSVRISGRGDARVRVKPDRNDVPVKVRVGREQPLAEVHVGLHGEVPTRRGFRLLLRDRHGVAWADLAGGPGLDGYVVRGGAQGVHGFEDRVRDELLVQEGGTLTDRAGASGVEKRGCRGREAAAIDFNTDGRLDLFSGCVGRVPLLHRQQPDGRFTIAPTAGLRRAGVRGAPFERGVGYRWAELSGRPAPELIAITKAGFEVFGFRSAKGWVRRQAIAGRHSGEVESLVSADFDGDGDVDAFAAARSGNTLLMNRGGRLRARDPAALGLPATGSLAASWVDVDNDSDLDLHLLPQGVFKQRANGRFRRTGMAGRPVIDRARVVWADLDSDGRRDAVIATRERGEELLRNVGAEGGWLAVDLTGPPRNRPAMGARVRVTAGGSTQTEWVGQSESSRASQGLYRLYFGLGKATVADVTVRWPDGSRTRLDEVAADQLLDLGI